jgi:hypothetical protein
MAAKQTAAQKHSACSVAHPSNWLSAKQVPNASLAMFQQAFFAPLFPKIQERYFFLLFSPNFTSREACLPAYGIF